MKFQYAGFQTADAHAEVVETQIANFIRGRKATTTHRQTITGEITIDDQGTPTLNQQALTDAIESFESHISVDGFDATLLDDSGAATHVYMPNGPSLNGTKVVSLNYPQGGGAEHAVFRHFQMVVEADYVDNNFLAAGGLVDYFETIQTLRSGLPEIVWTELPDGTPVSQTVVKRTIWHVVQSGRAVGLLSRPAPNSPRWPSKRVDHSRPQLEAPRNDNGTFVDWPISWNYEFKSATPLVGAPLAK